MRMGQQYQQALGLRKGFGRKPTVLDTTKKCGLWWGRRLGRLVVCAGYDKAAHRGTIGGAACEC